MPNYAATLANKLIEKACLKQASDIHIYPYHHTDIVPVYYRINGVRKKVKEINKASFDMLLTYIKFASNMDIGEIQKPQDGMMTYEVKQTNYALRISTLPMTNTESLTIRILPQTNTFPLEHFFIFPKQLNKLKTWLKNRAGMILFTGPTGSGKTSLMYALIHHLREKNLQIITLEDPVERQLDGIIQVNMNEKAQMTYSAGLKAALRHDPDLLMVGEMRDKKTAHFAFEAALTGHLLMSTVHARDTFGTIERLLDLGIERGELRESLLAVAAIELLPIIQNGQCVRRAAIVELLDGDSLREVIMGKKPYSQPIDCFKQLRKRAYICGYISEETYRQYQTEEDFG